MHHSLNLQTLLLVLTLSVVVVAVLHRFRIPSIAGFIVVGVLAGPHGLSIVPRSEDVQDLAELGVVLLLFSIGLEFSLSRLRRTWRVVLEAGAPYVLLTGGAGCLVAHALHLGWRTAIFAGFWLALSSTAIVLKSLTDRREVDTPHGRLTLSVLLFQDLCVVPMMLLLPILAGVKPAAAGSVVRILLQSGGILLAVLIISRYVVPTFLAYVARTRNRELFLLLVLLLCLSTAAAAGWMGLSAAIGAFLGGLLLSKSDYGMQALADILPFRDIFNSVFFMSIGMMLDLQVLTTEPGRVALATVGILLGKTVIGSSLAIMLGFPAAAAALSGIALAQVGEFSFVLAQAGSALNLMPSGVFQPLLAASVVTMAITPILITFAPRMARRVERAARGVPVPWLAHGRRAPSGPEVEKLHGHVVIVGYGLNGRNLARLLAGEKIPYVVLDLNGGVVAQARALDEPILFGDITSEYVARHLGLERARSVVISISDPQAERRAVRLIRESYPKVHILVRTRYVSEVDELHQLGANEVVPEEFETSIEIGARTLALYGTPLEQIRTRLEQVRADRYRALRAPSLTPREAETLAVVFGSVATGSVALPSGSPIVGVSLRELDLTGRTGATILAVLRAGEALANPNPSLVLDPHDAVVFMGSEEQVDTARALLTGEITLEDTGDEAAELPPA
jgi:CPA2 family monovalent cation:H+ antiporter-2